MKIFGLQFNIGKILFCALISLCVIFVLGFICTALVTAIVGILAIIKAALVWMFGIIPWKIVSVVGIIGFGFVYWIVWKLCNGSEGAWFDF